MGNSTAMVNFPKLTFLDHEVGVTKQLAPYHCEGCETSFKNLSGYFVHIKYFRTYNHCPDHDKLKKLGLHKVKHTANGNTYDVWDVIPLRQSKTAPDEVLVQLQDRAEPKNINQLGGKTFEQMAADTDNWTLLSVEQIKYRQAINKLKTAHLDSTRPPKTPNANEGTSWYPIPKDWREKLFAPVTPTTPKPSWWPLDSLANDYKQTKDGE